MMKIGLINYCEKRKGMLLEISILLRMSFSNLNLKEKIFSILKNSIYDSPKSGILSLLKMALFEKENIHETKIFFYKFIKMSHFQRLFISHTSKLITKRWNIFGNENVMLSKKHEFIKQKRFSILGSKLWFSLTFHSTYSVIKDSIIKGQMLLALKMAQLKKMHFHLENLLFTMLA